jgi:glycosyltransferase involved in cell wall biosynthesis
MPAYNEGEGLVLALQDVAAAVLAMVPGAEVIVVDDGSTDGTPARLEAVAAGMPALRVLRQANAGHGAALRAGIDSARGAALLLLDADRQIDLGGFPAHWAMFRDGPFDAVLGMRVPRHDPLHRLAITRVMRAMIRAVFGRAPQDGGVPYKILTRAAWERAAPDIPPGSAIPSVLLAILLLTDPDLRAVEVPVTHKARVSGRSVLRWGRLYRLCRDATRDILSLARRTRGRAARRGYAGARNDAKRDGT